MYANSLVLNSCSVRVHLLNAIEENWRRAPPGASARELHLPVRPSHQRISVPSNCPETELNAHCCSLVKS